jgi:hypothetical protein
VSPEEIAKGAKRNAKKSREEAKRISENYLRVFFAASFAAFAISP